MSETPMENDIASKVPAPEVVEAAMDVVETAKQDLSKVLSLQDIMDIDDITEETIPVPRWGGSVVIRSISFRQMEKLKAEADTDDGPDEESFQKRLLLHTMVSPNLTNMEDVEVLIGKSAASILTILAAIIKNSGLNMKVAVKEAERQFPA